MPEHVILLDSERRNTVNESNKTKSSTTSKAKPVRKWHETSTALKKQSLDYGDRGSSWPVVFILMLIKKKKNPAWHQEMTTQTEILKNAQLCWPLWRSTSWKSSILVGTDNDSQSYCAKAAQEWMFVGCFCCTFALSPSMPATCSTYHKYPAAKAKAFQPLNCRKSFHMQHWTRQVCDIFW